MDIYNVLEGKVIFNSFPQYPIVLFQLYCKSNELSIWNTTPGWNRLKRSNSNLGCFKKLSSSRPEVFLRKSILKLYRKFIREQPYWSVISIKLLYNFIEIALWHGCSPVNLLHISRTPFLKNTSRRLLLKVLLSRVYSKNN